MPSSTSRALPRLSTTAVRSIARTRVIWILAALVLVAAAVFVPAFRNPVSVNSLLAALAPVLLIATGQGIAVLFGGIDLSVGAIAGLGTVMLSFGASALGGPWVGVVTALLAGLVVGAANGFGVLGGVNPLLMTFAASGVVQGIALLLQGLPEQQMPFDLIALLGTSFGPVPLLAIVSVVVLIGAWWWMSQTRTGRVIQAAGFDPRIARRLGLPVRRTTVLVFALSGVLSAAGGVAIAVRTYAADALVASSAVIDSVATVLVAGIVITGGVGSLLSLLPAALVVAVAGQIITLTGTDAYYQTILRGVILIAAVGAYSIGRSRIRIPWRLRPSRTAPAQPAETATEVAR